MRFFLLSGLLWKIALVAGEDSVLQHCRPQIKACLEKDLLPRGTQPQEARRILAQCAATDLLATVRPLDCPVGDWFCAVNLDNPFEGQVVAKTTDLETAQAALGGGASDQTLAIIPMEGTRPGSPDSLAQTWDDDNTGMNYLETDIESMQDRCYTECTMAAKHFSECIDALTQSGDLTTDDRVGALSPDHVMTSFEGGVYRPAPFADGGRRRRLHETMKAEEVMGKVCRATILAIEGAQRSVTTGGQSEVVATCNYDIRRMVSTNQGAWSGTTKINVMSTPAARIPVEWMEWCKRSVKSDAVSDSNSSCPKWSNDGRCFTSETFLDLPMQYHCPLSCCTDATEEAAEEAEARKDDDGRKDDRAARKEEKKAKKNGGRRRVEEEEPLFPAEDLHNALIEELYNDGSPCSMVMPRSQATCTYGVSWGCDLESGESGIVWTTQGCRGVFIAHTMPDIPVECGGGGSPDTRYECDLPVLPRRGELTGPAKKEIEATMIDTMQEVGKRLGEPFDVSDVKVTEATVCGFPGMKLKMRVKDRTKYFKYVEDSCSCAQLCAGEDSWMMTVKKGKCYCRKRPESEKRNRTVRNKNFISSIPDGE